MATFGQYRSVNKLPNFASAVEANGGPFDPNVRVEIRLTRDDRYTINGYDALDENRQPRVYLDLRLFRNNAVNGVRYISNGLLQIDSDGRRYNLHISEAAPDRYLPYNIQMLFKDDPNAYYTTVISLPSDHPFLQAYQPVPA